MRHGKKINHLSRTTPHRKAMLANMANSLIESKRITTTIAKAKALRKYVEPLITKSKSNTTHSRRVVFSYLQNKYAVQTLFDEVAGKIGDRPGGYTRIIKMGNRLGDNADMALIELVDYNDLLLTEEKPEKAKTRRSRRGGSKSSTPVAESKPETTEVEATTDIVDEVAEEVVEAEEVVSEAEVVETEVAVDEVVAEVEEPVAEVDEVEEPATDTTETPEASAEGTSEDENKDNTDADEADAKKE